MAKQKKKKGGIYEFTRIALGQQSYGKRQFKRDLRKLKKAGLISGKIDIDVQAPTKYILGQIRKFKDVLSGQSKTIAINPGEKKFYRDAAYRVKNGRAIIPTPQGESVRRLPNQNGVPRFEVAPRRGTAGVRRREVLLPYTDLEQYVMNVVEASPDLPRGEYYGFRYFGNNSIRYYPGDEEGKRALLARVLHYSSMEDAVANGNADVEDEIYQNFMLVKIVGQKGRNDWEVEKQAQRAELREARRAGNRQRRLAWERNYYANMSEEQKLRRKTNRIINAQSNADAERRRREKMRTTDGDAYNKYKEEAKARARKSRANKKK